MLKKKQINLIIGVIVIVFSLLAVFFSNQNSSLIGVDSRGSLSPTVEVKGESVVLEITPSITPGESLPNKTLYRVLKVIDGDTIDVALDGKSERLRLIGINTPETVDPRKEVECFGHEASDKAKEILKDQFVVLENDPSQSERDKYGRLLRYVFLPDGTNYNLFMIEEGFAYEYTYNSAYKYQKEFKAAQEYAQNNGKGLWSSTTCSGKK